MRLKRNSIVVLKKRLQVGATEVSPLLLMCGRYCEMSLAALWYLSGRAAVFFLNRERERLVRHTYRVVYRSFK